MNGYEIDRLPIVKPSEGYESRVASLVEGRLSAYQDEKLCSRIDRQIDKLVYQLYGLTKKDVGVVEDYGNRN